MRLMPHLRAPHSFGPSLALLIFVISANPSVSGVAVAAPLNTPQINRGFALISSLPDSHHPETPCFPEAPLAEVENVAAESVTPPQETGNGGISLTGSRRLFGNGLTQKLGGCPRPRARPRLSTWPACSGLTDLDRHEWGTRHPSRFRRARKPRTPVSHFS
jgi:hypothetical protein